MEIPALCTLYTYSIVFVGVNTMQMLKKSGDKKRDASDFGKGKSVVSPAVVCFAV